MSAYTYIVECADGSLYTGWTTELEKRLQAHNRGAGAKYTSGRTPVRLVYFEKHPDESAARRRECAIKKLSRRQKLALCQGLR
ncbi:MAG: GIY-YIG nuclease family protein [Bacillota bacterium]